MKPVKESRLWARNCCGGAQANGGAVPMKCGGDRVENLWKEITENVRYSYKHTCLYLLLSIGALGARNFTLKTALHLRLFSTQNSLARKEKYVNRHMYTYTDIGTYICMYNYNNATAVATLCRLPRLPIWEHACQPSFTYCLCNFPTLLQL